MQSKTRGMYIHWYTYMYIFIGKFACICETKVIFPLQYSTLRSICTELLQTLCSPQRVLTLLHDTNSSSSASLLSVDTWARAVTTALSKLSDGFFSLTDMVQPFSVGLHKVSVLIFVCTYVFFLFTSIIVLTPQMLTGMTALSSIKSAMASANVC